MTIILGKREILLKCNQNDITCTVHIKKQEGSEKKFGVLYEWNNEKYIYLGTTKNEKANNNGKK